MGMTGLFLTIIAIAFISYTVYKLFLAFFLRDPERHIPSGSSIISPADGRILAITRIDDEKYEMKKGLAGRIRAFTSDLGPPPFIAVSIFMNIFDVHINRSPLAGKIININHKQGSFHNAAKPIAFDNEKLGTVIDTSIGRIKVIQIAGLVARRIETFLKTGDNVIKGQRIGLIKLGSQVTLIMPKDKIKITVKKGDRVYAGSSIIGEII